MNQWVMLVSAKSLVNWALRKRGKGLWRFLKVRHAQTDTEVVLLHSCRETSLSHRGTEGLGNQAPLCLARTARLEECLAVEALCTHERTHWKDIRLRWEEEARGQKKKKEKQDLYGKSTLIWLLRHLLNTNCRFCDTNIYTNICTKICQVKDAARNCYWSWGSAKYLWKDTIYWQRKNFDQIFMSLWSQTVSGVACKLILALALLISSTYLFSY